MIISLIALLALQDGQIAAAASSPQNDGTWTTYTTAHGLPSNSVWGGVVVDSAGNVWAGFEKGGWNYPLPQNQLVSRLDGDTWVNYELPGCRVTALAAADDVYAGAYCPGPPSGAGGGLSWSVDDTWVTFTPADGLAGTYVTSIVPEGKTKVWVTAGYNIYYHPYINLLDHKGTADKADDEWTLYTPDLVSFETAAIDPDGNRWFGGVPIQGFSDAGIWMLSADNQTWISYTSDLATSARGIVFDAMGNAWFERGYGVTRFDGDTWTYYNSREEAIEANYDAIMTSFNPHQAGAHSLPGLWVVEGRAGVWIIRNNDRNSREGTSFYDGDAWTIYTHENSSLTSNEVRGVAVDQQGNVWFGTEPRYNQAEGGVSKFTPPPDFSVNAVPGVVLIEPGWAATVDVSVLLDRGQVPTVTLAVSALPPTTSVIFSSNPVTPTTYSPLTITTTVTTPFGVYPLTVIATGAGMSRTTTITLHVVPNVYHYYWPVMFKLDFGQNS